MYSRFHEIFEDALKNGVFSGASLLLAAPQDILFHGTWGRTQTEGTPVTTQTFFDLASLTKPLVTAVLCMHAIKSGRIDLDDPLSRFFPPALIASDKQQVTIRFLLNHCSGLPAYQPYYRELIQIHPGARSAILLSWIAREALVSPPGKTCCYSDLGFMLLGMILEAVFETPLDQLATKLLFEALGNDELGFRRLPVGTDPTVHPVTPESSIAAFAATEYCPWRRRLLVGEVHDENAFSMGGVAGHAGLFGTAWGIFSLLSYLWNVYRGASDNGLCSSDILKTFWSKQNLAPGSSWALGFDTPSSEQPSAGKHYSPKSVGHLGFTGTSFWLDLDREVLVILLTNRVYPTRDNDKIRCFRPLLHNAAMEVFDDFAKR